MQGRLSPNGKYKKIGGPAYKGCVKNAELIFNFNSFSALSSPA